MAADPLPAADALVPSAIAAMEDIDEGQSELNTSAPYLGLVGMKIDDEPYTPQDEMNAPFITGSGSIADEQGQGTGMEYDLEGLQGESFDHDAAKARLRQYKKDAEERKRKKMMAQQREAERLSAEVAKEREKMNEIQRAREEETRQKAQGRFDRQRQEREERARMRLELKNASKSPVKTDVPLFKRREAEFERVREEEEKLRRQKLRQHQEHFKKIDFVALDRESREAKRQQEGEEEGLGGSKIIRVNPREKINLPPVNSHYYHGNSMSRAREEHLNQRNKANEAREGAARRRQAAVKYSRLVTELVPANPKARKPVRREASLAADRDGATASAQVTRGGLHVVQRHKPGRLDGADSGPSVFNEKEVRELSTRATALNRQARKLEEELGASNADMGFEDECRSKSTLATTYIDAIRTKVELLEAVRAG
jgi:hypothetical protein